MKRKSFLLYFVILVQILTPSKTIFADQSKRSGFYILYTGNTFGELKPCGCAREEDQGGIERRQTYLKSIRAKGLDLVLLDTGDIFKEFSRQGKIKARFLAKSMSHMAYDAISLGDKELIYGQKFFKSLPQIPWLSTNIEVVNNPPIPKFKIKSLRNGIRIAILALAEPDLFYTGPKSGITVTEPKKTLQTFLPKLVKKEQPDLIIALTHMKKKNALSLIDSNHLDIIINGHIEKETDTIDLEPIRRPGKIFVQSAPRGQKIGEIFVDLKSDGKQTYHHQMVPLDSKIQFDSEMRALYKKYNQKIEQIFLETLSLRRKKSKKKVYATDIICQKCHSKIHDTWKKSNHSKAFITLKKVNKGFDPECLVCHTVGFNQPGGFVSENDSPELANVQCEICHGPGLKHSKEPKPDWDRKASKACVKCHVKNHSPRFDYAEYWPRIRH